MFNLILIVDAAAKIVRAKFEFRFKRGGLIWQPVLRIAFFFKLNCFDIIAALGSCYISISFLNRSNNICAVSYKTAVYVVSKCKILLFLKIISINNLILYVYCLVHSEFIYELKIYSCNTMFTVPKIKQVTFENQLTVEVFLPCMFSMCWRKKKFYFPIVAVRAKQWSRWIIYLQIVHCYYASFARDQNLYHNGYDLTNQFTFSIKKMFIS